MGPYEVRLERDVYVVLLARKRTAATQGSGGAGQVAPLRVEWSPVIELPGHTWA